MSRKIGMWMYQNGGGDIIEEKIVKKLRERDITTITGLNPRNAIARNGHIYNSNVRSDELDLFFSYNAGEQTQYQVFLYQAMNRIMPMINSYESFALTEDKFQTSFLLQNTKIESEATLDTLLPFLNQMDLRFFYVEKFLKYDNTDFRVDIVDGEFVSCYGRKASGTDWRTNITAGGSVFKREANDEVVDLAKRAAEVCKIDIAGIDIIYDMEKEEYVVLEVNGIPAFATPEQEKSGLDFNEKKIDLIVDLIDKKTK